VLVGCIGSIDAPPPGTKVGVSVGTGAGGGAADTTPPMTPEACAVDPVSRMGATPMRRLTNYEYDNTVRDLLGDTTQPGSMFPPDQVNGFFDNTAVTQNVQVLLAEDYVSTAEALSIKAVTNLSALLGCDVASRGEATCSAQFIQTFGRRAFRRPLTSDERSRLQALFTAVRGQADFTTAIRAVLEAMLVSPYFLFRPELGQDLGSTVESARKLTGYEVASRLSYFLWATTPDAALLDAADAGQLETKDQVLAQAQRMLSDPRARAMTARMFDQWFSTPSVVGLSKDVAQLPPGFIFDDTVTQAMVAETRQFIDDVVWQGDGKISTLLTASYSFINAPLARLYGVPGITGTAMQRVTLDPTQRTGLLTQGSFLAQKARPNQSNPVTRGAYLITRVLCEPLAAPPPGVPPLPAPVAGKSTRELIAQHTADPACSACHKAIDGLGFGLEAYNASGMYRTADQGVPVDASGEVLGTHDVDGPYVGAVALAGKLAASRSTQTCAATQWLRYAEGRLDTPDDQCSIFKLREAFAASGGDLKQLLVLVTQSDSFLHYRRPD
jgi:hypothetical protein